MKKLFFSLLILLAGLPMLAQSFIALQSGTQVALFTHLEDAIAAANPGDDIYLPGGIVQVHSSDVTVDKKLNIYGVGYNAITTAATGRTFLNANVYFGASSNGSLITGVHVTNIYAVNMTNLTIKRCLTGTITLQDANSNIFITESIITYHLEGGNNDDVNVVVDKCIVGNYEVSDFAVRRFTGLLSRNSIIVAINNPNFNIYNSLFENSIFFGYYSGEPFSGGSGNVLNNCIFHSSSNSGQIVVNPIYNQSFEATFVNYNGGAFDPSYDYHLKSGSPGKGAGTDGTDIGPYGTSQPFKDGGLPDIPHIVFKSIAGSTDQNGRLQINIQVAAQDY